MRKQLTDQDEQRAVALYLRKSRKDRELEAQGGDTLERHEKILRDLAEKQGLVIGEIYKEVVSGDSIESRPEMQRLLVDVHNNKWPAVCVVELERLARGDTKDQGTVAEAFKYSETLIITPSKTYDPNDEFDEEYFEFGLFMSRREYKTIKRRLSNGIQLSVLEGNYLWPTAPYGYDIVDRGRRDRTLKENANADTVRMMYEWYTKEKVSICEITRRLTAMKIPSPKGLDYWSGYTVTKILKNDVYIGKIHYGKTRKVKEYKDDKLQTVFRASAPEDILTADGKHPAIIDMDTWNEAVRRHSKNAPVKSNYSLRNPLSGLLRCSKCGSMLHMRVNKSKGAGKEKVYTYYKFRHRPNYGSCKCVGVPEHHVISAVADALRMYIADFQAKIEDSGDGEAKAHAQMIATMEKNLEALKAKRKKIMVFFEDDVYTEEEFLERKKEINEEITMLTARIEAARNAQPSEIDYREKVVKFSEVLNALENPNVSAKAKNDLLKEIICSIDYTRESSKTPFTLDITLL